MCYSSTLRNVGAGWQGVEQHPHGRSRNPPQDPTEPRRRDNVDRFPSRQPCDGGRPRRRREAPRAYHEGHPDPANPLQAVAFGTSGHRGSSFSTTFNDDHIAATTQAIVEYRTGGHERAAVRGGRHARPLRPRLHTCVEVLVANDVTTPRRRRGRVHPDAGGVARDPRPQPRPGLRHRRRHRDHAVAQPAPGRRLQYNPPNGGPADTDATKWIAKRANELLAAKLDGVAPLLDRGDLQKYDFLGHYVDDLPAVVTCRRSGTPACASGPTRWAAPASPTGARSPSGTGSTSPSSTRRRPAVRVHDTRLGRQDPDGLLVAVRDGLARGRRGDYQIATGSDADADRHGIVTRDGGLMNPNHYLAVAIGYLYANRPGWPADTGIGKTAVSSSMIDFVAHDLGRRLVETPVGFKWFVPGLIDSSIGFGGEESAGASFLRTDGTVWTTDKDGLILCLLASEILAVTGQTPSERYRG